MTSNALVARNETFSLVQQAVRIALPGAVIRWEGRETTTLPTGRWLRASLRHVTGRQASLSDASGGMRYRHAGFFAAQCFAPLAENGVAEATRIATTVRDALQGKSTASCVWFRNARINEVGIEKDWFVVNTLVDFEYDEIVGVQPEVSEVQTFYPFPVASTQWIINHNLGRRASVEAYTTGGVQLWAQVTHVNNNQTIVEFDTPQDGYAIVDL